MSEIDSALELIKDKYKSYTFYENEDVIAYLDSNTNKEEQIEKICGIIEFEIDIDDDVYNIVVVNDQNIIVGLFRGYIEEDKITDTTVCAQSGKGLGEYLRYYALLKMNKTKKITSLSGAISGGIPSIKEDDSSLVVKVKQKKLLEYHEKRGAEITDDISKTKVFTYYLDTILKDIHLKSPKSPKKKRKSKKRKKKRKKKSKKKSKR
jgi:hypothetical protein